MTEPTPIYAATVTAYCKKFVVSLAAPLWDALDRADTALADRWNAGEEES